MQRKVIGLSALILGLVYGCGSDDARTDGGGGNSSVSGGASTKGTGGSSALSAAGGNANASAGVSAVAGEAAVGGTGTGTVSSQGTSGTSTSTSAPTTVPGEVAVSGLAPKAVSERFFGQNYWSWVPDWGDAVAKVESQATALNLRILRAGGANNDQQSPAPFTLEEVDGFVAYASSVGAEPLLQVPLLKNLQGGPATAQDAADLVTYVNVTKGYGIKYFSIGNEPDLYVEQTFQEPGYDAVAFCTSFKAFASAMREVDPSIKIVGPDLSWKYTSGANDWLTPFLENCGDETDIVAVHRYPLAPEACTEAAAYGDASKYRQAIKHLRSIMSATGQGDKPLAITEANITYDGTPAKSKLAASPGTFEAALWLADNLGVSLEEQLHSVSYWSLSEGWTLGFFSGTAPRPAAHVLELFSTQFGSEVLSVTGAPSQVSVYSGRDSANGKTALYVVNKSKNALSLKVSFTDLPRQATVDLQVAPLSLQVAIVPDDGQSPKITSFADGMTEPTTLP